MEDDPEFLGLGLLASVLSEEEEESKAQMNSDGMCCASSPVWGWATRRGRPRRWRLAASTADAAEVTIWFPPAIEQFIRAFDAGRFPDLIAAE